MEAETVSNTIVDQPLVQRAKNKPQQLSLNQIYQDGIGSSCGYCQKKDGSYSWSFTKPSMNSYTYQALIQRGWRRCGTYYYKPNLAKSCCKLWTHRLEADRFRPKRDQRKAVKRVIMIAYDRVENMEIEKTSTQNKPQMKNQLQTAKKIKEKVQVTQLSEGIKKQLEKVCLTIVEYLKIHLKSLIKRQNIEQDTPTHINYDLTGKLKFFSSKEQDSSDYYSNFVMLIFGLNKKLLHKQKYSLLEFVNDVKEGIESLNSINHFKVEVERGGYLLFKSLSKEHTKEFEILGQKQIKKESVMDIEGQLQKEKKETGLSQIISKIKNKFRKSSEEVKLHPPTISSLHSEDKHSSVFEVLKPQHQYKGEINISFNKITFGKLTIDIVKAEENIQAFKLYQDYCSTIHKKPEKDMSSYVNFLCLKALDYRQEESALNSQQKGQYLPSWDSQGKHQKSKKVTGIVKKLLGCYHMKYYLKGKLIGVGVIDIVDQGLSSVYFFYDPCYKEYRLGVFSSIIEIEYTKWLRLSFPQFKYYYMGFYVADSQKMNYKVDYMPCQLLCPITYQMVDLTEQVKSKVDKIVKGEESDLQLSVQGTKVIEDMHFGRDLGPYIDKNLKILYNGRRLVLKQINPLFFVHILKILNVNVRAWGKKVFDILTFTL